MFELLKTRIHHRNEVIKNLRKAKPPRMFRGLPVLSGNPDCGKCTACVDICPSRAIGLNPLSIDMGRCVFCGDCQKACPDRKIGFSPFHRLGATERNSLVVTESRKEEYFLSEAVRTERAVKSLFKRSFKLRQVSAGGCNGCEMELAACSNVNFDMFRYGIEFVASPRHADGLVVTGPITGNMSLALKDAYLGMPKPKVVIVVGACAISGGVFQSSPCLNRIFLEENPPALYVPGCPAHPLTFINALLDFLGRR